MTRVKMEQVSFWKNIDHIEYHSRQFKNKYRSTHHLGLFIKSLISEPKGQALDVACGAGANIYHFSEVFPSYDWTGVDIAGEITFPIGRKYFQEKAVRGTLVEGDFYKLTELFPNRKFDLVLSVQTLMGIPDYEPAVDQLLAMTSDWLIVSSLFTDFDVDARITAVDHTRSIEGEPFYYNVYSLKRFQAYCKARGVAEFVSRDFVIDADLPPPTSNGLNTYTRKLDSGERIQFSGPLHMPWKFIGMRMGQR
jgi:SAM-dependent methyltransferase